MSAVALQSSSTVASGSVISESPAAGTRVASGSAVNLVVSTGGGISSGDGGGGAFDSFTLAALLSSLIGGLWRARKIRDGVLCLEGEPHVDPGDIGGVIAKGGVR